MPVMENGSDLDLQTAVGALTVGVFSHFCIVSLDMCTAVVADERGQTRSLKCTAGSTSQKVPMVVEISSRNLGCHLEVGQLKRSSLAPIVAPGSGEEGEGRWLASVNVNTCGTEAGETFEQSATGRKH